MWCCGCCGDGEDERQQPLLRGSSVADSGAAAAADADATTRDTATRDTMKSYSDATAVVRVTLHDVDGGEAMQGGSAVPSMAARQQTYAPGRLASPRDALLAAAADDRQARMASGDSDSSFIFEQRERMSRQQLAAHPAMGVVVPEPDRATESQYRMSDMEFLESGRASASH